MAESNYYLRRLTQAIVTILGTVTFAFVVIRLVPGGPADYMAAQLRSRSDGTISAAQINRMVNRYTNVNPDKPILEAYVDYMVALAQGDFGESIRFGEPVWDVLGPALPWTMFVSLFSLVFSLVIVFLIGGFLAVHEGDKWDIAGSYFVIFSSSLPYYIVGLVLLFVLGFQTEFFPSGGRYDNSLTPGFNVPFMLSALHHAALPILSFALTSWGGLEFRAHCTRIIGEDYVEVAHLRGLPKSRIQLRYIGWNSTLPMYTGLMAGLATIFGGSVIMERIFRYRGMGHYFVEATLARDYPLIMAAVILFTVVTVVALLVADLTYGLIDPRAGHTDRESFSRSYRERIRRFLNGLGSSRRSRGRANAVDDRSDSNVGSEGVLDFDVEDSEFGWGAYGRERIDRSILTPFRIIWTSPRARVGGIIVAIFFFMGFFGKHLVGPPTAMQGDFLIQPLNPNYTHHVFGIPEFSVGEWTYTGIWEFPLGTDQIGADLFAQNVLAARPMLVMMGSGAAVTILTAIILGVGGGYVGGVFDKVAMTFTDIMLNIPGLALVIVLATILEPDDPAVVGVVLAIDNWPRLARQLRSQVLTIREEPHVEASRVLGLPTRSILTKNIMSRLSPLLMMGTAGAMRGVLLESVALYFIGVLPYTNQNWGVLLNAARNNGALSGADRFHMILAPMLFIATLTFGLQLFAQGTDRLFNPRLRAKHAATVSDEEMESGGETGRTRSEEPTI